MLISSLRFRPAINKLKRTISGVTLGVTLSVSLISCQASLVSIDRISQRKINKTVQLTGKVVQIAPFVEHAAYQIEDVTGKIWVVTTQNPPKIGEPVSIRGQVKYQSLPFAEQDLGELYLVELEQLAIPVDKI